MPSETLNETEKQRILARVRKLLTLANNQGATEGERDNALRMAHATMAKYNFDIAEAEAAGRTTAEAARVIVKNYFYGRPWARTVSSSVAEMLFCVYIYTTAKRATDVTHWFIGRESNATTASELSAYLVRSIWKEAHKRARERDLGNEYARNFATGAAQAIYLRCQDLREKPDESTKVPGTALVLASFYDREKAANQKVIESWKVKQVKPRSKRLSRADALIEGQRYGGTLSLNRQIEEK